ncbi:6-phosphogluconate dehydrogenase family protein [Purpureocillium lilacinum]|uniref:6-phosphogluconate dehydrogenase family protein n=1 Tax=Purpureocillium lilacinum TaxID=33203 RepID=A0A179HM09_PURLI|nr:6-phosphogluconate dehydrogenase family protein [Purpureocillium lilacinum]OAQ90500.1 6-phosphogluconate dehydrogenase family protein [Purpureocillium lilacinum]
MPSDKLPRVAWLGLGNIGLAVCRNLAKYGPTNGPVTVWNRTHQKAADLAAESDAFVAATDLADVVSSSDIICLCLVDDAAVAQVLDDAIRATSVKGKLFVDFSTVHPDTAAAQADKLPRHGAEYLASPIFGGVPLAVDRLITLVLAGSAQAIERFTPFTDGVICKSTILLVDEPCEQASLLKLIGNFIRFSTIEVLCEASVLSEKLGMGQETLSKFVETLIPGPAAGQLRMLNSGSYHSEKKPMIPISMAVKENNHLNDLAQKNGVKLKTLETVTHHTNSVTAKRGPDANLLAIYGSIREDSGLPFEN